MASCLYSSIGKNTYIFSFVSATILKDEFGVIRNSMPFEIGRQLIAPLPSQTKAAFGRSSFWYLKLFAS